MYQYAYDSGADLIIDTCSSVGETVDVVGNMLDIPVYRIDSIMIKNAVSEYDRIGVLATLNSTLSPTCRLIKRESELQHRHVIVVEGLADGAYELALDGNKAAHDQRIIDTAKRIRNDCDVLLLAQGSMASIKDALEQESGLPVKTSPEVFFDWLRKEIEGE